LLAAKKLRVKPLISAVFPLAKAGEAYEWLTGKNKSLGILLEYGNEGRAEGGKYPEGAGDEGESGEQGEEAKNKSLSLSWEADSGPGQNKNGRSWRRGADHWHLSGGRNSREMLRL